MAQIVMPTHTNGVGGVLFGGILMQWIDVCAAIAAMRHCGGAAVTASIDRLDFLVPIRVGDIVVLQAQVNYASRTSMEVGCRVETEDPRSGERRYTTKAYLTFVALDGAGKPRPVPAITAETAHDERRCEQAAKRRADRLRLAGKSLPPPAPEAVAAPRKKRAKAPSAAQPSPSRRRSSKTRA
jgi:acyl-CoA hydrolase